MKNFCRLIVAMLLVVSVISLVACGEKRVVIDEESKKVVITVSSEVMEITENTTLEDYMKVLKEKEELDYKASDGQYGLFIEEINGIKPQGANEFWAVYTNDTDNSDTAWGVCEYNGVEYGSSMYGVSSLKIKDGCVYILTISSF